MTAADRGEEPLFLQALPQLHRLILGSDSLKHLGFTKTQLIVLISVGRRKQLHMGQIAEYISSSKEQATRAVAPLVDRGLLERHSDPDNRTHVCVTLTAAGRALMDQCREDFTAELEERLDKSLSPEEREALARAVTTLIRLLDKVV